jgi:hypothetical protein
MKYKLVTTLLVVAALVVVTISAVTTTARPALAAEASTWPINGGCPPPAPPGTPPPCANDNMILRWDEQLLSAIRAYPAATGPTITSRAIGVLHTATYDAWAAYDPVAKGTRPGPRQQSNNTLANKNEAISYAAYRVLDDLFPATKFPSVAPTTSPPSPGYSTPDILLRSLNPTYDPDNTALASTTDTAATPAGVGNLAAKAVLDFRRGDLTVPTDYGDGSNQRGTDPNGTTVPAPVPYSDTTTPHYQALNTWNSVPQPWHWQPLCVLTATGVTNNYPPVADPAGGCPAPYYTKQNPATPHWGTIKPFALLSPFQYKVLGPPKKADGTCCSPNDIVTALADTSNLDDVKKAKAEYWADGPKTEFPPGHMAVIAQAVSRKRNHSVDTDAKMFFALGNALLDAGIASWAYKYKKEYDFVRPVTAIREYYKNDPNGITTWLGPNKGYAKRPAAQWMPYQALTVVTPPFPEYVSGHSTFTGAGADILQAFTGSDTFNASVTIPAGTWKIESGPANPVTLSWPTFTAAAFEAGWSRRYGGIHFKSGDEHGRALGKQIGATVWSRAQAYIRGSTGYGS